MMTRQVDQIGFIVNDLKKAMAEYGKIYRIPHWYRAVNLPQGKIYYQGEEICDPGFDAIVGYCGRTEIELITTSLSNNLYGRFLQESGPGLHHICFFVKDIDGAIREYEAQGFVLIQHGVMQGRTMASRYAYLVKPGEKFSRIVELGETKLGRFTVRRSAFGMRLGCITGDAVQLT